MFLRNLIDARLLDVDQLAANGKDRLVTAIAALLGGAAGGITLDDIKLSQVRIAFGTIRQFAGQAATGKRAFADRFAGFPRCFAGAGRG